MLRRVGSRHLVTSRNVAAIPASLQWNQSDGLQPKLRRCRIHTPLAAGVATPCLTARRFQSTADADGSRPTASNFTWENAHTELQGMSAAVASGELTQFKALQNARAYLKDIDVLSVITHPSQALDLLLLMLKLKFSPNSALEKDLLAFVADRAEELDVQDLLQVAMHSEDSAAGGGLAFWSRVAALDQVAARAVEIAPTLTLLEATLLARFARRASGAARAPSKEPIPSELNPLDADVMHPLDRIATATDQRLHVLMNDEEGIPLSDIIVAWHHGGSEHTVAAFEAAIVKQVKIGVTLADATQLLRLLASRSPHTSVAVRELAATVTTPLHDALAVAADSPDAAAEFFAAVTLCGSSGKISAKLEARLKGYVAEAEVLSAVDLCSLVDALAVIKVKDDKMASTLKREITSRAVAILDGGEEISTDAAGGVVAIARVLAVGLGDSQEIAVNVLKRLPTSAVSSFSASEVENGVEAAIACEAFTQTDLIVALAARGMSVRDSLNTHQVAVLAYLVGKASAAGSGAVELSKESCDAMLSSLLGRAVALAKFATTRDDPLLSATSIAAAGIGDASINNSPMSAHDIALLLRGLEAGGYRPEFRSKAHQFLAARVLDCCSEYSIAEVTSLTLLSHDLKLSVGTTLTKNLVQQMRAGIPAMTAEEVIEAVEVLHIVGQRDLPGVEAMLQRFAEITGAAPPVAAEIEAETADGKKANTKKVHRRGKQRGAKVELAKALPLEDAERLLPLMVRLASTLFKMKFQQVWAKQRIDSIVMACPASAFERYVKDGSGDRSADVALLALIAGSETQRGIVNRLMKLSTPDTAATTPSVPTTTTPKKKGAKKPKSGPSQGEELTSELPTRDLVILLGCPSCDSAVVLRIISSRIAAERQRLQELNDAKLKDAAASSPTASPAVPAAAIATNVRREIVSTADVLESLLGKEPFPSDLFPSAIECVVGLRSQSMRAAGVSLAAELCSASLHETTPRDMARVFRLLTPVASEKGAIPLAFFRLLGKPLAEAVVNCSVEETICVLNVYAKCQVRDDRVVRVLFQQCTSHRRAIAESKSLMQTVRAAIAVFGAHWAGSLATMETKEELSAKKKAVNERKRTVSQYGKQK